MSGSRSVVIGSAGQLGRDLCARLPDEVVPLTRTEADLINPTGVRDVLNAVRPTAVINCAAYNLVDKAEDEHDAAFAVNAFAVLRLAETCRDLEVPLMHFSTDYVFGLDAMRRLPFHESDAPGPVSVYGASKLAGEHFVRSICPRHFVVRTCGLYGRWGSGGKGTNFVETMLRLAPQRKPLPVVQDQVCTPTYTVDLAEASVRLLQTDAYGLYHLTNAGACSWHEFAERIFSLSGVSADLTATTSRELGRPARRPAYSVLTSERADAPRLRPWTEALAAYLKVRAAKP